VPRDEEAERQEIKRMCCKNEEAVSNRCETRDAEVIGDQG
jgi:hypothetical protein